MPSLCIATLVIQPTPDLQGHAYELQDVVHWQSICEGKAKWYYHLNITVRTKPAADPETGSGDLFFAEVSRVPGDVLGYFLSCFYRVQPDGDGILKSCIFLTLIQLSLTCMCEAT
jgi:hypothetical protein